TKNIIFNGSPRINGNTSALTAEFTRGAESSENKVTEFFLGSMNINEGKRVQQYRLPCIRDIFFPYRLFEHKGFPDFGFLPPPKKPLQPFVYGID
ncbi:MAG: hypothetical protein K2K02_08100, partial [Ruminococcus sp.]|nr:hypothetical protein [Ruminococcus sp.]